MCKTHPHFSFDPDSSDWPIHSGLTNGQILLAYFHFWSCPVKLFLIFGAVSPPRTRNCTKIVCKRRVFGAVSPQSTKEGDDF